MDTLKLFFKIMSRNKIGIIIYTIITIILLVVLSSSKSESGKATYEKVDIPFSVIDNDNSTLSKAFTKSLAKENKLVECDKDINKLRNSLFYRQMYYVLIIPEGYQEKLMAGEKVELENIKVKDSVMAYYMEMNVQSYISLIENYRNAGFDVDECIKYVDETLKEKTDVSLLDAEKTSSYDTSYYYYNMFAYILMAIVITIISPMLVAVNNQEVRRRINCSSVKFTKKNLEYGVSTFIFSIVIWLLLNILGIVLFANVLTLEKILLNLLNSFCLLLVTFAIGYLCGNLVNNKETIAAMTNVISLGMSFLSGIFVPMEVLSEGIRKVAKILPAYWYSKCCSCISLNTNFGTAEIKQLGTYMGIELLFAVAIFIIALVAIKKIRVIE